MFWNNSEHLAAARPAASLRDRRRRRRTMRGGKREFNGGGGGGGGGGHRKKAKWFNHKGVRARATTNERGVFFMCAREKSAETGESDEKDDG